MLGEAARKLANNVLVARRLEALDNHVFRKGFRLVDGQTHLPRRPETQKFVPARLRLELHLGVIRKLVLMRLFLSSELAIRHLFCSVRFELLVFQYLSGALAHDIASARFDLVHHRVAVGRFEAVFLEGLAEKLAHFIKIRVRNAEMPVKMF